MGSPLRPLVLRQLLSSGPGRQCLRSSTSSFSSLSKQQFRHSRTKTLQIFQEPCLKSGATQVALLHQSARRAILPPKPQVIEGTVNDPVPVMEPHPTHGSYHWTFERLVSVGLIPLTIAPFAAGSLNPTMDALLCATLLVHSHIGFQALIIDYLPAKRVPKSRAAAWWGLRAATILVGVGLYEFETNDVGITEGIKRVWRA